MFEIKFISINMSFIWITVFGHVAEIVVGPYHHVQIQYNGKILIWPPEKEIHEHGALFSTAHRIPACNSHSIGDGIHSITAS